MPKSIFVYFVALFFLIGSVLFLSSFFLNSSSSELIKQNDEIIFEAKNISIIDAMEKISKTGFGLGLIKIKGSVKGIFTDGDLRRMINNRIDLTSTPIKEVMTKNFKFVKDVDLVLDVSRIMEDQKIYSLVVKNSNKKITGLIRMHEILSAKII